MKRLLFVLMLCIGLAMLTGATLASAQEFNSGIQVYNLSSELAHIVVSFYNQDGSVAASPGYTIDPNSSITLYPLDVADGFFGSVVIYSDWPVVAVSNITGLGSGYAINASYESSAEGADQVNLPLIMRNNPSARPISTWFNVQNAGTEDAEVQVDYYPLPGIGNTDTEYATIKPGASATFDQATNSDLGTRFLGSAVISSTNGVPLVAAATEERTTPSQWETLMAYRGFTEGSSTIALPLIMANNGAAKLWTGLQIQNMGTISTTITVSYGPNIGGTWNPAGPDVQTDVGPGESMNVLNDNVTWSAGNRYLGSATVTSSNGQPLVAIVNQSGTKSGIYQASAYTGLGPNSATSKVIAPLIMSCNPNCNRLWTGLQVMNVHDTISTTITVTFLPSPGFAAKTDEIVLDVGPGESANFLQNAGATTNWDGTRWIGAAVITASGDTPIVALVNESWKVITSGDGERLLTYVGFNVEP